eukprot:CAMPEP_0197858770 /NCGR_PEP_ID=MMETSP1438-20131217/32805_1 /TAXON_ID=1461541 /ORGANISM="Pterosperma sp., Strain CCMP1384" /LENGTH=54 /DNA_ID=CAMNT_0043475029 /DNA_START=182 /DNA_END=346 /DNA_ORIENTATION=+
MPQIFMVWCKNFNRGRRGEGSTDYTFFNPVHRLYKQYESSSPAVLLTLQVGEEF